MPPVEKQSEKAEVVQHSNGQFLNKRNQKIYCYYWKPQEKPRALLLISHGYTEHSMLYEVLAKEMARRGFFVFAHDHVGHGHSDGQRAYINDVHHLVEDSVQHIQRVQKDYPELSVFMCGHSMGGAVALFTALVKEIEMTGVLLIAPALASNPETATFFKVILAKVLGKFIPQLPLGQTDFSLACQNKIKVDEMNKDPLRYRGFWKARPIASLLQGAEELLMKAPEFNTPYCLLHGDHDKICHVDGSKKFHELSVSSDKTLKIYPGAYHSLLNEPDEIADEVFDNCVKWLDERA